MSRLSGLGLRLADLAHSLARDSLARPAAEAGAGAGRTLLPTPGAVSAAASAASSSPDALSALPPRVSSARVAR